MSYDPKAAAKRALEGIEKREARAAQREQLEIDNFHSCKFSSIIWMELAFKAEAGEDDDRNIWFSAEECLRFAILAERREEKE